MRKTLARSRRLDATTRSTTERGNFVDGLLGVALRVPVLLQTARGIRTHSLLYHAGDEP